MSARVLAESQDVQQAREVQNGIIGLLQLWRVVINDRSDLRARDVPDSAVAEPPKRNAIGVVPRRPDEWRAEFGVKLYRPEIVAHPLWDTPAGPLPSMHLGDSAGESLERHGAFIFDDAEDDSSQNTGSTSR